MVEKRPLVWLSAANSVNNSRIELASEWTLTHFNLHSQVPLLSAVPQGAKVGVIEFPRHTRSDVPWPENWLETLGLTYWVAIAPQSPVTGTRMARIISRYCSDFHTLPVDYQRFSTVLGHLWGMATLQESTETSACDSYQALALTGNSRAIQQVRSLLRRFSATQEPVLIAGENSTGKEAAARFVHAHSARANGPFVIINCAALPPTLTQSELFGYEKGAFTHALTARAGRIEQANGGSLVFVGIDELKPEQQSIILRFLQEGLVERVGGTAPIPVNCRIIATTSRSLPDMIAAGQFRSDVYYRLGGLEVELPPLKNRLEDIPAIARKILSAFCQGSAKKRLSKEAVQHLVAYAWPGNFRELQNCVRQGWLLSDRATIDAADLGFAPERLGRGAPSSFSLKAFRARADQQALLCSLRLANNNMTEAARLLNISRVSLYRLMNKYNSEKPE